MIAAVIVAVLAPFVPALVYPHLTRTGRRALDRIAPVYFAAVAVAAILIVCAAA